MSIQLTVPPTIRPFRGFEDPALPNGYWAVHASVLGDGSGGLMSVNIRFSSATEPNPSTLWNLEQLTVSHTGTNTLFRMDLGNMDPFPIGPSTGALRKEYEEILSATISGRSTNTTAKILPIFLGAAGKAVNGDLAFDVTNVNATSLSVFAQGYFWGPEAINAPGGPQRPVTGLFGR